MHINQTTSTFITHASQDELESIRVAYEAQMSELQGALDKMGGQYTRQFERYAWWACMRQLGHRLVEHLWMQLHRFDLANLLSAATDFRLPHPGLHSFEADQAQALADLNAQHAASLAALRAALAEAEGIAQDARAASQVRRETCLTMGVAVGSGMDDWLNRWMPATKARRPTYGWGPAWLIAPRAWVRLGLYCHLAREAQQHKLPEQLSKPLPWMSAT